MEPRQVISTELARATIGVLINSPRARILSSTAPTITGYSPDGNLFNYVSYISEISFHTHSSEDLAVIHGHGPLLLSIKRPLPHYAKVRKKHALRHTPHSTVLLRATLLSHWSDLHAGGVLSGLAPAVYICSSVQVALQISEVQCRGDRAIVTVGCSPQFFTTTVWRRLWEPQFSMHLRSRNLPRPSASSPPGNRSHPMADPAQAPDLEGLHREIHDMAEQMRIMNENNGRLMQLLAAAKPPLPAAPLIPDVERSRHSNRSGNRSRNIREEPRRGDHARARDKSTSQKIRDLDARLDAINTGVGAPVTVDTLIKQTEPPFTERILRARISSKFKLPAQLGMYEGKIDPMDHLDSYKSLMSLQGCSDEVMCKAFSATLKGPARSWFRKLSPGTIDSFGDLSRLFVANFMSCRNRQKNASHLFTIHQKESESLKEFVKRFNQAILEVEDPSDKVIIMAMMEGLRPGPLFDSLSKNVPENLSALQSKADKYIAAEELAEAKRRRRGKDDHKRKEPDTRRADYREKTRYKRPNRDPKRSNNRRPRTPPRRPEFILPPLNAPVAQKGDTATIDQLRGIYKRSMEASDQVDVRLHPGKSMLGVPLDHRMAGFYCGRLDCPSPYNAILGRPTLGGIKAITSTYHLKMKFPTLTGIGEVKGDQKVARQCFISAMKVGTSVQSAQ
ncbi:hypothetical protein Acr_00g0025180 [Actinidia rufa]|uniref:Retrotransposon gag domain-containing protein n=1 Tax=Actinidia rufa TaxID=165716 RepID=A0A7J0DDT9_9ERIC|nr:hypothetical protein Acr_00g0025180 [Actinidia rufa]